MDDIDLKRPDLYINRELSLLEFNWRVLDQAKDPATPLLERLRFLCISCTNLDEFFEVRVAGLMQRAQAGSTQVDPDNMAPSDILKAVSVRARAVVDEQYRVFNDVLLPSLEEQGIYSIKRTDWSPEQEAWLRGYFESELLPMLSPLGLDSAHPFPRILNKSLNFIVSLRGKDAFGRNSGMAIVQAPRSLPRVIKLPSTGDDGRHNFVFLSSVVHAYVGQLFHGMKVRECHQFRVTRNSELFVDEEEIDDLLLAVEGELVSRNYGDAVRLEVTNECPDDMAQFLLARFGMSTDDLYRVNGPVNLNRAQAIADLVDRPDLKFPGFTPRLPVWIASGADIFKAIRTSDILLHHPFDSFAPVIEFVRQAASDPKVLAIKQTLYRTGPDTAIVDVLVAAAKAGKEVTVVIELRARFDEEVNIALANRLQEAGVHVVYGVVGYKTHAKMIMVVRRENGSLRHYVHLGTGNYHPRTARLYTDYGLFSCNTEIGRDVHQVFLQLTSLGKVSKLNRLFQSPFTLYDALIAKIEREIKNASRGKPSRIIAKMNSLTDPQIIQALYRAAMAGVQIDLIVRSMCSLRPGVPGVSGRIRVRSVVGRFLEHTRVYYFENGGQPEVYCSSADWMGRNLFRRVEVCFPLEDTTLKQKVITDLHNYLKDNIQAWELQPDGGYHRVAPGDEAPFSAQQAFLQELLE
ncbi:MAG TPA: polyphosphate kinase 1 [Gammaproteobacteria bacterium]|nr:polyphosphate kinase 1 [Gammaproteobacteria bacterium]